MNKSVMNVATLARAWSSLPEFRRLTSAAERRQDVAPGVSLGSAENRTQSPEGATGAVHAAPSGLGLRALRNLGLAPGATVWRPSGTKASVRRLATAATIAVLFCTSTFAGDWRQFRGDATNSVAIGEKLPTELSGGSIAWEVDLPGRGVSGPIVIGEQVILTASSGYDQDRLHIMSFDAETGETQWERQFLATGRTVCHEKMSVATPTPASDGERIYAFYSSKRFDLHRSCRQPSVVPRTGRRIPECQQQSGHVIVADCHRFHSGCSGGKRR